MSSNNFANLLVTASVSVGLVSKEFTGRMAPPVYYATLNWGSGRQALSRILTSADLDREEVSEDDGHYDREVYPLLIQSPWFPMVTGVTPQLALSNFIDKINKPYLTEHLHLQRFLVEKVLKRWREKTLKDPVVGGFTFHIDMSNVVPDSEKGFVVPSPTLSLPALPH